MRNENISGNHLGVSVGVLLHHQRYIIGFRAARINMPNASLSDQVQLNLPIRLSLQGGFEFDLRPRTSSFFSSDTSQFYTRFDLTDYRYGGDTNKRLNQNNY